MTLNNEISRELIAWEYNNINNDNEIYYSAKYNIKKSTRYPEVTNSLWHEGVNGKSVTVMRRTIFSALHVLLPRIFSFLLFYFAGSGPSNQDDKTSSGSRRLSSTVYPSRLPFPFFLIFIITFFFFFFRLPCDAVCLCACIYGSFIFEDVCRFNTSFFTQFLCTRAGVASSLCSLKCKLIQNENRQKIQILFTSKTIL